ncbi:MAG: 16S rRNA (adenine(1518)-N(6)/adenine(1519)-N(6))-dimethyltransferase RsmA [Infirmifilum sp.]
MECLRRAYSLRFRKQLGQHMLVDERFASMFAEVVDEGSVVYEIGCGLGSLTLPLSRVASYVFCSEIDPSLVKLLKECRGGMGKVDVVLTDAVFFTTSKSRHVVVSNTPFYLSSRIIAMLCRDASLVYAVLGIQREVGERMLAPPGTSIYGRLSILTQLCFSVEKLFTIPREAYKPRPQVETVVVKLIPRKELSPESIEAVESFTRSVFPYRRKKLSTGIVLGYGLKKEEVRRILSESGVDPDKRVDEISPDEALSLALKFSLTSRGLSTPRG